MGNEKSITNSAEPVLDHAKSKAPPTHDGIDINNSDHEDRVTNGTTHGAGCEEFYGSEIGFRRKRNRDNDNDRAYPFPRRL